MTTPPPADPNKDLHDQIDEAVIQAEGTQAWDDFWSEVEREELAERGEAATEVIRGVTVQVPHDLPLKFDRKLDKLKNSSDEADMRELLELLFGGDVLDQWVENGMKSTEFQTVLTWGLANGKGKALTFREAYELGKQQNQAEGKAPAPKTGPVATRSRSGASGGRSKRTSAASTKSSRGNSPT